MFVKVQNTWLIFPYATMKLAVHARQEMMDHFQSSRLIPATDVSLMMLDEALTFFDYFSGYSLTPSHPCCSSATDTKGFWFLERWHLVSLVLCDFSPAKSTRMTNEMTDHTPASVQRNARGLLTEKTVRVPNVAAHR